MSLTKKQKEVYDYIKSYFEYHGHSPTQIEIKDHFGLKSLGSVQKYLQYLHESGMIANEWNKRRGLVLLSPSDENKDVAVIPLLGIVSAGVPIDAILQNASLITIPKTMIRGKGEYFAVNVEGDSMKNAGIFSGDILICERKDEAINGQIIVAAVNHEVTVKEYFYQTQDHSVNLIPHNNDFKTLRISKNDQSDQSFYIVGIVKSLWRNYV